MLATVPHLAASGRPNGVLPVLTGLLEFRVRYLDRFYTATGTAMPCITLQAHLS